MENSGSLIKLNQATRMLAELKNIDDAAKLIDLAEAARIYARQVGLGLEAQNHAAEIKVRAQRKAGEILDKMEKNKGAATRLEAQTTLPSTYDELGIKKYDAHVWQKIATLSENIFEKYINKAFTEEIELTTAAVYRMARQESIRLDHELKNAMPWPTGTFQVICADPPWRYENSGFDESAENQYPTMALEDICDIPVADLTTERTVLFLWATNPLLPEALEVLSSWGFLYKTNLVWIKDKGRGKGWFLKSKHELLLIGTRNETFHPKERPDSCFEADRGSIHSRKPEIAYRIIEQMYDGPRLELFAREKREGWVIWGNEISLKE